MSRDRLVVVDGGVVGVPMPADELADAEPDDSLEARVRAALSLAPMPLLVDHLHAHPELALHLVDAVRIARPWQRLGRGWARYDARRMSLALVEPSGKLWWWECHVCKGRGRVSSETDALAVADQVLIEAGWTLAGGRRG